MAPLRDAAAVNSTRWSLFHRLVVLGLPVETGSGGLTKWNRLQRGIPKTHWLDAVAVGVSTLEQIHWQTMVPLQIAALGRHNRQMQHVTERGFPVGKPKRTSEVGGYRSGDLVRAVVPTPLKTAGVHVGTISIRATGSCDITTNVRRVGGSPSTTAGSCSGWMASATLGEVGRFLPRLKTGASAPHSSDF